MWSRDDPGDLVYRVARLPVAPVVGAWAAGLDAREQREVEALQVVDVICLRRRQVRMVFLERQHDVERRRQAEVESAELDVGEAAGEGGVAIDVVAGDDREHRLDVPGAGVDRGRELVDAHVGGAVQPHLAVRVRELGGPVDKRGAVPALDRVEEAPLSGRAPRSAHVGDYVDVSALDQVGVVARELAELAAARVLGIVLAVRGLREDDGESCRRPPCRSCDSSGSRRWR